MHIPPNIIVNADDIGLSLSVNRAILYSFKQGYINSTSLLTNMNYFDDAVELIKANPEIINVGVHGNFAEGRPLTDFKAVQFLTPDGKWNIAETNRVFRVLNKASKKAFAGELNAQIEKALAAGIEITHLDSHLHLHALPAFFNLYVEAAKKYGLKLRLAQTYNEGSYIKYAYRRYINSILVSEGINYSCFFETVHEFLKKSTNGLNRQSIEIMVHPDFKENGLLYDHVDNTSMNKWISFLKQNH